MFHFAFKRLKNTELCTSATELGALCEYFRIQFSFGSINRTVALSWDFTHRLNLHKVIIDSTICISR